MHTSLLRLTVITYQIVALATSAPATADALSRASVGLGTVILSTLRALATFACMPAYAQNKEPGTKLPVISSSKPVIWVNYADPRPKGDDADPGTQPSFYPRVSIDNVSLMPAVSITLFAFHPINSPLPCSPTITYSPPTVTFASGNTLVSGKFVEQYSFAADPGSFGNCWSDNLSPCIERSAHYAEIMFDGYYETTLSVNNSPSPAASFKGTHLRGYEANDLLATNIIWYPQPLTKASAFNRPRTVLYWRSGLVIDETAAPADTYKEIRDLSLRSSVHRTWPSAIRDRNSNTLCFAFTPSSYPSPTIFSASLTMQVVEGSGNWFSNFSYDVSTPPLRVPTCVSNPAAPDALVLSHALFTQDVLAGSNTFFVTTPAVTNVAYRSNGVTLRTAELSYHLFDYDIRYGGFPYQYKLCLLTSIRLPDGSILSNFYTGIAMGPAQSVPFLSRILHLAHGTTTVIADISYSPFRPRAYEDSGTFKFEPDWVRVVSYNGLITNFYQRIGNAYNFATRRGSASMLTITPTATTNQKIYSLFYEPLNKQWYGCEVLNTLDGLNQFSYTLDARFRYTSLSRYPYGGSAPSDTTSFLYDDRDNLIRVTDACGYVTRYFYAPNKLDQTCIIDPRGVVTTNIYDSRGNLLVSIEDYNGLRRTSSNVYNTAGQVIKSFDPLGRVTRNYYSTSRIPAAPSYYAANEPSPLSNGFLVATRDPLDRVTTFTYDALGRKIIENSPGDPAHHNGRYTVTNTYDIMDRLVRTMYPDGTYISNVYSAAGYPVRVRDRMGRWTVNTYDAAGHLLRVDYPNGDWVQKDYLGNLVTRVIDARHNTTDYYYCHEQLTGVRFPDGSTRAAGFDNLNRQIWAVDERGVAVTNVYDKLDRLVFSQYLPAHQLGATKNTPAAPPAGFAYPATTNSLIYGGFENQWLSNAYDAVGNLIATHDWAALSTNAYDTLNRRIYEFTRNLAHDASYAQSHSYDLADNRLGMTLTAPQNTIINSYTYDHLNRLASLNSVGLRTVAANYTYNLNGKLASVTAAEGNDTRAARVFSYDSEQRLAAITGTYNGVFKLALSYSYNHAQQITSIGENIEGETHSYTFAYDQRDQLTNETVAGLATFYGYDKAQNRVMKKSGTDGSPDTYSFSFANKLTNIYAGAQNANHRYFYDLAGNLVTSIVSSITNLYFYNAQNKLARVLTHQYNTQQQEHIEYVFGYDSLNRRVSITRSVTSVLHTTETRVTIHDGCVPLAELTPEPGGARIYRYFVRGAGIAEGTGDVIAEVLHSGGSPDAMFYLSNHRGDTLAVYMNYNATPYRAAKYRYDAFGNIRESDTLYTPRYLFSTKEYLPDAKLYLYQYRVYDPIAGRWTQRDPIDYEDSINLYQFCGNSPVNAADPDGRLVEILVILAVVVVAGGTIVCALIAADEAGQAFVREVNQGNTTQAVENYTENMKGVVAIAEMGVDLVGGVRAGSKAAAATIAENPKAVVGAGVSGPARKLAAKGGAALGQRIANASPTAEEPSPASSSQYESKRKSCSKQSHL